MNIIAFLLTVIAAFTLYVPVYAQSSDQPEPGILILTDQQGKYPLGRHLYILEDPSGELTIEDVVSPEYAARFEPSQSAVPNYGYSESAYWLRLRLQNESNLINQWLLETNFQNLNYVDVYIPTQEGGYLVKESGVMRPFDTRDIPYYHVVFDLPLRTQEEGTLYIRVETGSSVTLGFTVWAPESFAVEKISAMFVVGLFYGALLIALGYHLFLFFSLREANYLYFVLFIASSILFWATYEGIADQFLWPDLSELKLYLLVITQALFFISSVKFSDVFLEQKTRAPQLHRLFNLLMGLWFLMIAILPFFNYYMMSRFTQILIMLTPVLAALAGIYSLRKGFRPARFYLVSWMGFIVGMLVVELVRLGFLPSTPLTERTYQVGEIWLVLMWSIALADRINQLKAETEDANRALGKSESRLSQILEGLPLGVVVYENDQKPSYINKRTSEILSNPSRNIHPDLSAGRTLSQAMNYFNFHVLGSDQPYPIEKMPVQLALLGDQAMADDIEADLVDRRVPLEIWANPIKDGSGTIEQVVVAFQDITQRKKTEAELDEYRNHLEQMVAKRTAEISAINEQLNQEVQERQFLEVILHKRIEWLSTVNRVHQSISGPADLADAFDSLSALMIQLLGASSAFIGYWDGKSDRIEALYRNQATEPPQTISFSSRFLISDPSLYEKFEQGKLIFLKADQAQAMPDLTSQFTHNGDQSSILLAPMKTRQTLIGLLGLEIQQQRYEDISGEEADLIERIALDLANLIEDARLLEKAQALAANEERNRLARDLHDSVTQVLFSASLVAEVLPRIWERDSETALRSLEELKRLTRGALAEMRTLLLELRPAAVVKTQLGELLVQLTEAITSRSGLSFELYIEQIPVLPEDVHISFYRIAQEGLNNVVKHAHASQVTVSLVAHPDRRSTENGWRGEIKLVIKDNGVGFAIQDEPIGHMGFSIMHERARSINAEVIINSQPGYGTELTLTWHN